VIIKVKNLNNNWKQYTLTGVGFEARLYRKGKDPIFAKDGGLIIQGGTYDGLWIIPDDTLVGSGDLNFVK